MTEESRKSLHPISLVLCSAYQTLYERGEVSFPLLDKHIKSIDSVVKTVNASYFGRVRYPSPEEQAAAYFCYLIKDHPVTDGNKRLAVLWLQVFCDALGLQFALPEGVTLDMVAVSVERSPGEIDRLIEITRRVLFS